MAGYSITFSSGELYHSDELYHHGILGMKWGVRRYQNADGTRTEAGRRRYGENLDINDKSRRNVAKIRLGEARRRYDYAKEHNPKNDYRTAELRRRVKAAKRAVKDAKRIDKGAHLASKGRSITGNSYRKAIAIGSAAIATTALSKFLTSRYNKVPKEKVKAGHALVVNSLYLIGATVIGSASLGYRMKQNANNRNLRAYNMALRNGESSIKRVGSEEYADVVKRRKNSK